MSLEKMAGDDSESKGGLRFHLVIQVCVTPPSFVPDGHGRGCIRRLYKIWKNHVSLLIRFKLGFELALWHVG